MVAHQHHLARLATLGTEHLLSSSCSSERHGDDSGDHQHWRRRPGKAAVSVMAGAARSSVLRVRNPRASTELLCYGASTFPTCGSIGEVLEASSQVLGMSLHPP